MSGLCAIINWNNEPVKPSYLEHMLKLVQHRGPDGVYFDIDRNAGFGHTKNLLSANQAAHKQPVWLPDKSCCIVADCNLYNRTELLTRIRRQSWWSSHPSDAEIILAGFEKYQADIFDLLNGDFAIIIFDRVKQSVIAARDAFSMKPLFYYWAENHFLAGSEPKQLLTLPDTPVELDNIIIGEHLLHTYEDAERTFFRDIRRVKPGHYLEATMHGVSQIRYWCPSSDELHYKDKRDYFQRFRELLTQSTLSRLEVDGPVVAHLSGGLDSTAIVALAAEGLKNTGVDSKLITLSSYFDGLDCDESREIEEFRRTLPFEHRSYQPHHNILEGGVEEDLWRADAPLLDVQRSRMHQASSIARSTGAKVVLTGVGGDEVVTEGYFLVDLASRMRYFQLIRECAQLARMQQGASFPRFLRVALMQSAPNALKKIYRSMRPAATPWQGPEWLNRDYFEEYKTYPEVKKDICVQFKSHMQQYTFKAFLDPFYYWGLEAWEVRDAYDGLEVRHPFMDRSLVEYVLSIPLDGRLPVNGRQKQLIRQGLQGYLTPGIINKREKTDFDSYVCSLLNNNHGQMKEVLFATDTWASEPYINRQSAMKLLDSFTKMSSPVWYYDSRPIWTIFTLELWLRQISNYNNFKP